MRTVSWVYVGVLCLVLGGSSVSAESRQGGEVSAAHNVELMADLDRVMQDMYDRSATFRAQWERIASAPRLHVRVRIAKWIPSAFRAYTVIRRRGRDVWAEVNLPPGAHLAEIIAHEFEHLLEQMENLNIRELARVRGSGVRELTHEAFETERAEAAGRLVVEEMRRHPRVPAAD